MPESNPRPLHLHTPDSLLRELVSGRSVATSADSLFSLSDDRTRSALEWYRSAGASSWASNISAKICESLVDATLLTPPELNPTSNETESNSGGQLRLRKLEAHRFAGLHKFGTPGDPPQNYIHEFNSSITLFEGRNGSGKTSLLNAIIWALTGEILRPQREPENAQDFECWVSQETSDDEATPHKLSSVTPMPNTDQYRPEQAWVHTDTWVELTFVNEADVELPKIRRSLERSARGKLKENQPDLATLGIDPIAARMGTVMPGLLSLIKVGSASELGQAVSQLTGLSSLVDLANHAGRATKKIEGEFSKTKNAECLQADANYDTAKGDLKAILAEHPRLAPEESVPPPSGDASIEKTIDRITSHIIKTKSEAFESASEILGEKFDPANPALLSDLEKHIDSAMEWSSNLTQLPSVAKLGQLRKVTEEELNAAETKIQSIVSEAHELKLLAENPAQAARIRLYARIAAWLDEHPDPDRENDNCVVCGGALESAVDPVTGQKVKAHLQDAAKNSNLFSNTLKNWAHSALGQLMRDIPESLSANSNSGLPAHPCDLLRSAFVDELFAQPPFAGVLSELKPGIATAFDKAVVNSAPLKEPEKTELPKGFDELEQALDRISLAIRFARWRHQNGALASTISTLVLGNTSEEGKKETTLMGKLLSLQNTVVAARPISDALEQCNRLEKHLAARRTAEVRLKEYAKTCTALRKLAELGELADAQVEQLRATLRGDATEWRMRIYQGAFPDTAHELVDTKLGRKGELDLTVEAGGVAAPAQHVVNASALRANLVAFFLAFWSHLYKERGGLAILVFDDPQELLDDENRGRLAESFLSLVKNNAQIIMTSYDSRFCGYISQLNVESGVRHFEVHPATPLQPVLRTSPPLPEIMARKAAYDADPNDEEAARNFVDGCRVFLECKLGDMFDEPAHSAWRMKPENRNPTLHAFVCRLRSSVGQNPKGMFAAKVFRKFAEHPALTDNSALILLMNKAHHGNRNEIRAGDVSVCSDDLGKLLKLVEKMYEECYRWMRRDAQGEEEQPAKSAAKITTESQKPNWLTSQSLDLPDIVVCPDLAAFTQPTSAGESQESIESLGQNILRDTVSVLLRRENFGFSAPAGSLAIIKADPDDAPDRSLVIAVAENKIYARRLVRSASGDNIGLTAEVLDPRSKTPKSIIEHTAELAVHEVVGIIFEHSIPFSNGDDEAIQVDAIKELEKVTVAFRVRDDSAVPLALNRQIVLGGALLNLEEFERHTGALVALTLEDGASLFKRVGEALPGELKNLRQFESVGGLGNSQILSLNESHSGFEVVSSARIIVGVLYNV